MIDRRTLLKAALAGMGAAALPAWAAGPGRPDPALVLLNRLTFGATPKSRAALDGAGRAAWLDHQLALPARDPGLDARLAALRLRIAYEAGEDAGRSWDAVDEARPLLWLDADPASVLPLRDWEVGMDWAERVRPAEEAICASLVRMVHAPAQVREVLTQTWHDHFNVHSQKDEVTAVHFPAYDAALREHALGRFRDLLGAVARSPAMLHYLNNADSRASPANENFARELLELHTLGVAAYLNGTTPHARDVPLGPEGVAVGYVDEDVYEVARAFTGWTIGDGRWVAEGEEAPRTGLFHYQDSWHDPYQKRVLGLAFDPNREALADGEQVLDLLAAHPATARNVCTRIARRLLADEPDPGLVDRLAGAFLRHRDSPDQIAQVVRALVEDPAFAAPPRKLRRPVEVLAALLRASGAEAAPAENGHAWQLARAGWQQHAWAPPDGHPDRAGAWMGAASLLRVAEMALFAHDDWYGASASRLSNLPPGLRTLGDLWAHWSGRVQGAPSDGPWEALGLDPAEPVPEDEGSRHDLSAAMVGLAALSPAFLWR